MKNFDFYDGTEFSDVEYPGNYFPALARIVSETGIWTDGTDWFERYEYVYQWCLSRTNTLKIKATGPAFDGCHELDQHDNEKWFALGGKDIQVWGEEWVLLGTREAIDYIAIVYDLVTEVG